MKKRNLFVWIAVFALISCSRNEDPAPPGNCEVEFGANSAVIDLKVSTRGAYEGTLSPTNPLTALVLTAKAQNSYTTANIFCNGTMTFVGNSVGANVAYNKPITSGNYILPETGDYYMSALYPATGWNLTANDGKAGFTITGKEDVMFAPQDVTRKALVTAGTYPLMSFTHQLALLRLWFNGNAAAVAAPITVTGIQLIAVNGGAISDKVDVNLSATPQTVAFSGTAAALDCYTTGTDVKFTTPYAITITPTQIAYILAPPTPITVAENYEYTFRIDYTMGTTAKSVLANVDMFDAIGTTLALGDSNKGYAFKLDFNFEGGQVQAVASVEDWKSSNIIPPIDITP